MLKIKNRFFIFFFIFLFFFISGCSNSVPSLPPIPHLTEPPVSSELRVFFLDVGQGDAELIITPKGKTILVDGGPGDNVLSKLGDILPIGQKKIDTVILTHPHADHLEGLIPVLKRYAVGEIYYSGAIHTTDEFLIWLKLIKEKNIPLRLVDKQLVVEYEKGIKLDFLYPNKDLSASSLPNSELQENKSQKSNNLNNISIVFKLVYGQTSFLFMGDAERPVEKELIGECVGDRQSCSLQADVLKVGHHGSHSSTSEEFLKVVKPQIAVIEVGQDNDFGHPHLITLRRLERHNIKICRTDELGNIEIKSDGKNILIKK